MFGKPSLMTRIAVGKLVGFVIGLIGFVLLPFVWPESGWLLRWGILLWYTTVGAIIGLFGVIDFHPILKMRLDWWMRGPWVGAWMNFVLTFFAYDQMHAFLVSFFGKSSALTSPFWFVLEGAIVGLIIAFFSTRFGGEGAETAGK